MGNLIDDFKRDFDALTQDLGKYPAQTAKSREILLPAVATDDLIRDVIKRMLEVVGRWELAETKGPKTTFDRYEFRQNLSYGWYYSSVTFYSGPSGSYYAGPATSNIPDNVWKETGRFIPGPRDPKGGFSLILFPSNRDSFQDLRVQMVPLGLRIGYRVFKNAGSPRTAG